MTKTGPGRPKYQPTFPTRKEWTFLDLMDANNVNPNTGKGKNCTKLTLTKFLDRDLWIRAERRGKKKGKILRANAHSLVVRLEGVFAEPDSKSGLGRKGFVYSLRAKLNGKATKPAKVAKAPKAEAKTRKPRKAKDELSQATQTYEDIKAVLATPTPAVVVTPAPEPTPAPATPVASETPAPAPEAVAAETAAVAAEATTVPSVS